MWQHFGGRLNAPPGTYHHDNHQHVTYFWNMFDQVLVRPGLIDNLDTERIEIVQNVGSVSLVSLLTRKGIGRLGRLGSSSLTL